MREVWRTRPVASAFGPTIIPGVSTSETIGRSNASQSCMKRAALSAASLVIAPGHEARVVGDDPDRPALDVHERGDHLAREALAQERHRALVGERLEIGATAYARRSRSGTRSRSRVWSGAGAAAAVRVK
jgi:hypothetical protein